MNWQHYITVYCNSPKVSIALKALVKAGTPITTVNNIPQIDQQVMALLQVKTAKPNLCYQNSWYIANNVPGVNYVEGFLSVKFQFFTQTVSHAWLEYGGLHFDVTPLTMHDRRLGRRLNIAYFHFYTLPNNLLASKNTSFMSMMTGPFSETDLPLP